MMMLLQQALDLSILLVAEPMGEPHQPQQTKQCAELGPSRLWGRGIVCMHASFQGASCQPNMFGPDPIHMSLDQGLLFDMAEAPT